MDEVLVSIVVPVYNALDTLDACVQSALEQPVSGLELILVDDGSSDGSAGHAADWARRDSRVRPVLRPHAGLSAARNAGMAAARGEFLCFLDSDDLLLPGALAAACRLAADEELDVLIYEYLALRGEAISAAWLRGRAYEGVMRGEALYAGMAAAGDYRCVAWGQLLRRDYARRAKLAFVEGILYEDELFTLEALLRAGRAAHLYQPVYLYRLRESSIVHAPDSFEKARCTLYVALAVARMGLADGLSDEARVQVLANARTLLSLADRRYDAWRGREKAGGRGQESFLKP